MKPTLSILIPLAMVAAGCDRHIQAERRDLTSFTNNMVQLYNSVSLGMARSNVYEKIGNALRNASLVAGLSCLCGCVTGTTIEAAREHVNYKPQKVEDGKIAPLEVESIEKAKPGYYALVPFAVVADVALIPYYIGLVIAVNTGLVKPP